MKRKVCTILTAVALFVSGSTTAYAADVSHSSEGVREELGVESSLAETTTEFYRGTSYSVTLLGMSCQCNWTEISTNPVTYSVWAFTGYSSTVGVTISSKAYDKPGNVLGSNSSGGGQTGTTTYIASGDIYYSYQVHSASSGSITAHVYLYRY